MRSRYLRGLALFFLAAAMGLLVWSFWPNQRSQETIQVRNPGAIDAGLPQQLTLTWIEVLRLGEKGEFVLSLPDRDAAGLPAAAQVEARLELNGVELEPGWRILQTVSPGKPVTLRWLVKPVEAGRLEGTLWLTWTATLNGQEHRLPVLARPIQMQVNAFLGCPLWVAQLSALGCMVLGGILFVFKRKKRFAQH